MLAEREHNLIGLIYDAALNTELWSDVLKGIVDYTESKTAIFTACDQLNPKYDFVYSHNIPEEGLLAYQDEQIKVIDMKLHAPLLLQAGVGGASALNWQSYAEQIATDEYIFYEKCLKPTGICYAAGVLLEQSQYQWAVLGIHRAPSCHLYQQKELDILQRIGTHLRRSLQIHRQLSEVKQENQDLYTILNCLTTGIIILNKDTGLIFANHKAQSILEKSSLLTLDRFNRLKTRNQFQVQLNQYILGALFQTHVKSQTASEIGGVLALTEDENQKPLTLSIVPFSHLKGFNTTQHSQEHQVAVFITEPNQHHRLATTYLKQAYHLSNRELEICELFINGFDLPMIAEQCGITLSSVRTYLKNIFDKTKSGSQTELMQFLFNLTLDFEHIH